MSGPFHRRGDVIEMRFADHEAHLLRQLPFLLDGVGRDGDDPAADRLDVPVYLDQPTVDEEFREWMRAELDRARAADRSVFVDLVSAGERGAKASPEEAEAFLRVLTEARLVVAARLGIEVEEDYERVAAPDAAVLDFLGALQTLLIRELAR